MNLARGCRAKSKIRMNEYEMLPIGLKPDALLIIKLPDSPVLQIISRSLFLAMIIFTLPSITSILRSSSVASCENEDLVGFEPLPVLFQDLADEGLLKRGDKGLIASSTCTIGDLVEDLQFLNENGIDLMIIESDLHRQSSIPNDSFDFVFMSKIWGPEFVDRVLKIGGIVVMQLGNDPLNEFRLRPNYRIVYLRRFDSTVMAMRKIGMGDGGTASRRLLTSRKLCGVTPEAKQAALTGLEDILLEPPRRALVKSRKQLKKIKFLSHLLGDTLENYQHRFFITDEKNAAVEWFYKNYPTRNQHFEVYNLEIEMYNAKGKLASRGVGGLSEWLTKNVRKEDYVVMKAEALLVEEMMKEKTICLVDELFLECKNQWDDDGGKKYESKKRTYWQCLDLYGRLRDEGIAVHQWWG